MKEKVAIQGFKASFHEIAAYTYFGQEIEPIECDSFQALFNAMEEDGAADCAVMAIENSVAGSILPNYARLRESDLQIVGEVYLRIEMNLMALKGETMSSLKEVHSHPMAILQCQQFFKQYPHIRLVESKDTALSAIEIVEANIPHRGALGSRLIAETFGLDILAEGIETNKRNYTRFLVLRRTKDISETQTIPNKSSFSFRTLHRPGSLSAALSALAMFGMNLTKIQSLPVLGEEWKYYMYADIEFDNYEDYKEMLKVLQPLTSDLKILGEYVEGQKYL